MTAAAGHHVFSIHSKLKAANLDYAYVTGHTEERAEHEAYAAKEAARCERLGNVLSSTDADCWIEAKMAGVLVPPAEFEHVFLQALEAVGRHTFARDSPLDRLDGAPDRGPVLALDQADPDFYRKRRWRACAPDSQECIGGP